MNELRDKLVTRAIELLDKSEIEEKLDAKLDIFKAVTAFYTAAMKVGGKAPPPDDTGFDAVRRRLAGGGPVKVNGDA